MAHCDFTELYAEHPPVNVCPASGKIRRDRGGSHRTYFWAGYDLFGVGGRTGLYPPSRNGGLADTAYRAGVAYRRQVDQGTKDPIPTK